MTTPARIVITGGAGFVGRAVVSAFVARGNPVTVIDRNPHPDPAVQSIVGELTDESLVADALQGAALNGGALNGGALNGGALSGGALSGGALPGEEVAGVVHLAAITSVLRSIEHPAATYEANVAVTQHLLEGCRQAGIERLIMASTNAVVGDVGHAIVNETVPLRPMTPYGATKAACEMLLSGYASAYGMATCALRFTNIYGPGMGAKDSFVPRLMRAALAGQGVQIYGDGLQLRDLVHVQDVVQAVLAAWDRSYSGTAIIGAGESVTVLQLVEAVRFVTGCALPVAHVAAKPGEMPAVVVDISRAREQLGYQPTVSLIDGLATVWQDFSQVGGPGW